MKLKFQNGNVLHASFEIGNAFLASGLATEVSTVAQVPLTATSWTVGVDQSGDVYINAQCGNGLCRNNPGVQHRAYGANAAKATFSHCSKNELPPENIVKRFHTVRENPDRDE